MLDQFYNRTFFLIICAVYLHKKLLYIQNSTKFSIGVDVFFSLFLASIVCATEEYLQMLRPIMMTLFISGFLTLYYDQTFKVSVVTSIISVSVSYVFGLISAALVYLGKYLILGPEPDHIAIKLVLFTVVGVFQFSLIRLLFSFPRLKKGMPFLRNEKFADIGIVVSLILISCVILGTNKGSIRIYVGVVLIYGMFLFLW